ncbi:MAG: hypothetical protein Q7T05_01795 [Dehalococcoidia bacterium]|nr:hypothetical protein [Dehalococcoidia bacterium]
MATSSDWQQQNGELLSLITKMGRAREFEERRSIFRQEMFRAFAPAFFPSIIQFTFSSSDERFQPVMLNILAAAATEIRDYLARVSPTMVQPAALCAGLIAAGLAAGYDTSPDDFLNEQVEQAKVIIRFRSNIRERRTQIDSELRKIAEAINVRVAHNDSAEQALRSLEDGVRFLPARLDVFERLLALSETDDVQVGGRVLLSSKDDPDVIFICGYATAKALEQLGDRSKSGKVTESLESLMTHLVRQGYVPPGRR